MRIVFILLLSVIAPIIVVAQEGNYYLTHFNPAEQNFDNYNYDLTQDNLGIVHVANRQGLMSFDGETWSLTRTPFALFTVVIDDAQNLYAGGRNGFGRFVLDQEFNLSYTPIDSTSKDVFDAHYANGNIYFINDHSVGIYAISDNVLTYINSEEHGQLIDIDGYADEVWVSTENSGIMELSGNTLEEPEMQALERTQIKRQNATGAIIHYSFYGLFYEQSDLGFKRIIVQDDGYINNHTVTQLEWINEQLVAISTLTGGVVFMNAETGEIMEITNQESGLPDNEIYTMFTDHDGALWVAHSLGISIISPQLPFRTFSQYPGLKGNLQQVVHFEDNIYVATSAGVFKLNPQREYIEEVITETKTVMDTTQAEPLPAKRKGLFGFLKRKKQTAEVLEVEPEVISTTKTIRKLKSISFAFEPIANINTKATQFVIFDNSLFVATRGGAFEITEDGSRKILNQPIHHMFGHEPSGLLFASTANETTSVLEKDDGTWVDTNILHGLNDLIGQMITDSTGTIWLCGADSVYQVGMDELGIQNIDVYHIDNPHFESLHAMHFENQLVFLNTSGYYVFGNNRLIRNRDIENQIGLPNKFLLSSKGNLWVNTASGWYGQNQSEDKGLSFLNLVQDPKALDIDQDQNFWVITSENQLFRVNRMAVDRLPKEHGLFLKEIKTADKTVAPSEISIQQEDGAITFEYLTPDFTGIYGTKYQYRLLGLSDQWSEWSTQNNKVSYPYLPANDYVLEIRTRDVLGNIENAPPVEFSVKSPYWRRPWFYALELMFFGGLLYLSFSLNRKSNKYTFLSRLLGFMTLILVVEFFQTIAESKLETDQSPVLDFFIQAFIALLILPVEGLIRKYITGDTIVPIPEESPSEKTSGE